MKGVPTFLLIMGLFAVKFAVGSDALALAGTAFVVGSAIAVIRLMFDRNVRSFDATLQWMVVKDQAVFSALAGLVFAVICVWATMNEKSPGLDFAGLGLFAGYSAGSLLWWALVRKRALA